MTSNGWDQLNRMTSFTSGGGSPVTTNYTYRPDGLRVQKAVTGGNLTSFAYDGQMGFEDVDAGASPAVTDYAIGGRGIDRLAKTVSGFTGVSYPIYDGHGNMVATLAESGSSYSVGNQRSYDAWGNILTSNGTGDPKGRYCASLGHKQDDESGLTYMRARFEDPQTGRFVSQDPSMQGRNWFAYCNNQPVTKADQSGKSADEIEDILDKMLQKGLISRDFWRVFMDRSTGVRDLVHDEITGQNYSEGEIMDSISFEYDKYESGVSLETDAEVEGDLEAGEDMSEILLEEEVVIAEESTGL